MFSAYRTQLPTIEAVEFTFSGVELCGICEISDDLRTDLESLLAITQSDLSYPILLASSETAVLRQPRCRIAERKPQALDPPRAQVSDIDPPPPKLAA